MEEEEEEEAKILTDPSQVLCEADHSSSQRAAETNATWPVSLDFSRQLPPPPKLCASQVDSSTMNKPSRTRYLSPSILWTLLLLITLINSTLALPTNSSYRLRRQDADNGSSSTGSDPGNDASGGSNNMGTAASSSSSGSGSMSALSKEPVTVQLGAGFIIGCVLGVVGYAIVKLIMKMVRGGMEVSAERRGTSTRQRRGSAISGRSEDRPDLFQI